MSEVLIVVYFFPFLDAVWWWAVLGVHPLNPGVFRRRKKTKTEQNGTKVLPIPTPSFPAVGMAQRENGRENTPRSRCFEVENENKNQNKQIREKSG